jgi:hypothetical protein
MMKGMSGNRQMSKKMKSMMRDDNMDLEGLGL